jgi:hypothetical protein
VQDQLAEQHGLPRLRWTAGHVRDRGRDRESSEVIGVPARAIQEKNLLKEATSSVTADRATRERTATGSWRTSASTSGHQKEIDAFNAKSETHKKGMAIMPICFGISFTNTPMNHAHALVHVYQTAAWAWSTGAVEMGQGVNTRDGFRSPVSLLDRSIPGEGWKARTRRGWRTPVLAPPVPRPT